MVRPYAHFRTQTVVAVYILHELGNTDNYCIRDVIGHPPYGHGAREIGGSHE